MTHLPLPIWRLTVAIGVMLATFPSPARSDDDEPNLTMRVYDLSEFLAVPHAATDLDRLTDLVTAMIEPDSWDEVGGPGSIVLYEELLLVSQNLKVHTQIAELHSYLRRLRKVKTIADLPPRMVHGFIYAEEFAEFEAQRKWRKKNVSWRFDRKPLVEVARLLSKQLGVPIRIDTKSLKEFGISGKTLVTSAIRNVPAGTAVRELLRGIASPPDLQFRDGTFWITLRPETGCVLYTRIYPVADLAGADPAAYDRLASLVMKTLEPDSWDPVGGPGSIFALPTFHALVLSNDETIHQKTRDLLKQLRQAKRQASAATPSPERLARTYDPDRFVTAIYYLDDGKPSNDDEPSPVDPKALIAMVQAIVQPDSWKSNRTAIRVVGHRLIIRHQKSAHREIFQLLDPLGLLETNSFGQELPQFLKPDARPVRAQEARTPNASKPPAQQVESVSPKPPRPARKRIPLPPVGKMHVQFHDKLPSATSELSMAQRALDRRVSIAMNHVALSDIVERLAPAADITILFDRYAWEDKGAAIKKAPVTLRLSDVTFRSALTHILRAADGTLGFETTDGILRITKAGGQLHTGVYWIDDLLPLSESQDDNGLFKVFGTHSDPNMADSDRYDYLIDMIYLSVVRDSWDEVGGVGTLEWLDDILVVSQTDEAIDQIKHFLDALRQAPRYDEPHQGGPSVAAISEACRAAEARIDSALDRKITLTKGKQSLAEAIGLLRRKLGVNIVIDRQALDADHIDLDTLVTVNATGIPARTLLKRILRSVNESLTTDPWNEALLITMEGETENFEQTVVHPVGDLVSFGSAHIEAMDFDGLIELITMLVQPDAWPTGGGPGPVREFAPRPSLVVRLRADMHRDVAQLLDAIRAARRTRSKQPPRADEARTDTDRPEEQPKIVSYHLNVAAKSTRGYLSPDDAEQLTLLIGEVIQPDSWNAPNTYVGRFGDQIVVKQTRTAHNDIHRLLHQLGVWYTIGPPKNVF